MSQEGEKDSKADICACGCVREVHFGPEGQCGNCKQCGVFRVPSIITVPLEWNRSTEPKASVPTSFVERAFADRVELERFRSEVQSLAARLEAAEGALRKIAKQNLYAEMSETTREDADWLTGYETIVDIARAALSPKEKKT